MFNTSAVDTEANKSSADANPCNVYRSVFNWLFPGTKAVHNLQFSLSNGRVPDLLQWRWQLPVLE